MEDTESSETSHEVSEFVFSLSLGLSSKLTSDLSPAMHKQLLIFFQIYGNYCKAFG